MSQESQESAAKSSGQLTEQQCWGQCSERVKTAQCMHAQSIYGTMAARVASPITQGGPLPGQKETGGVARPQCHWRGDCTGSCTHGPRTRKAAAQMQWPNTSNVSTHTRHEHTREHTQDTLGAAALMVDNGNRSSQPAPCDTPCGCKPQGLAHHTPTSPSLTTSGRSTDTQRHSSSCWRTTLRV